jgi:hypothetical protein
MSNPNDELGVSRADAEHLGLSDEDLEMVAGGQDAAAAAGKTTIIIIEDPK